MREVAVGIAVRRDALVDLEDVDPRPRHVLGGQQAQHHPRRVPAADREGEAPARLHRLARRRRDQLRGALRDRVGIGENLDLHVDCSLRGHRGRTSREDLSVVRSASGDL